MLYSCHGRLDDYFRHHNRFNDFYTGSCDVLDWSLWLVDIEANERRIKLGYQDWTWQKRMIGFLQGALAKEWAKIGLSVFSFLFANLVINNNHPEPA